MVRLEMGFYLAHTSKSSSIRNMSDNKQRPIKVIKRDTEKVVDARRTEIAMLKLLTIKYPSQTRQFLSEFMLTSVKPLSDNVR